MLYICLPSITSNCPSSYLHPFLPVPHPPPHLSTSTPYIHTYIHPLTHIPSLFLILPSLPFGPQSPKLFLIFTSFPSALQPLLPPSQPLSPAVPGVISLAVTPGKEAGDTRPNRHVIASNPIGCISLPAQSLKKAFTPSGP